MESRPRLAKIQVAATLRGMRERSGVTRDQAAEALNCTTSKIGDLETGRSRPRLAELEKLLDLYAAEGTERDELLEAARDARSRRRPRTPETSLPTAHQRFADLERQARKIIFFSPELLPGFLQLDDYVRGLMRWRRSWSADEIDRLVAWREHRRSIIARPDGPTFRCVLGEPALLSNAGGPRAMAEQLRFVLRMDTELPNLILQVLPLGSGMHGSLGITRSVLEFDPPAGPVIHVDTNVRNVFYDDAAEVEQVVYEMDILKSLALDPGRSRSLIERAIARYEEASTDDQVGRVVHPAPLRRLQQLRGGAPEQ